MTKGIQLILVFISSTVMAASLSYASARFENNTLVIPYLEYENQLFSVELALVASGAQIDFVLSSYSTVPDSTDAPANVAHFAGTVLSIPALRVGVETYQVQLDYIDSDGVFRLVEAPAIIMASTDGVVCDYADSTPNASASLTITSVSTWNCTDGSRKLTANGIPDHAVGTFPSPANPNTISAQSVSAEFPLMPVETTSATTLGGPRGPVGFVLNGVKIDPSTAGTCNDSGSVCNLAGGGPGWNIEALGQTSFDFGEDENNAHVQPTGEYHYHGIPEGFVTKRGGNSNTMTLIGWAVDGFPIYARYGYSIADNANSPLKVITGSYQLVSTVSPSRPSVSVYPLGTFSQDWEFVEGSGDLDRCNGRYGVTPEFPNGIYHYYATDSYPYFQRCVTGVTATQNFP